MKAKTEIVIAPEQFTQMSADEIARYIMENKNTAIVGDEVGQDRHVIKYNIHNDWTNYKNPF